MAIFNSLKQYFSKDINPDVDKITGIVFPYPLKGGEVKMNSKITIKENFAVVLGKNGKALDYFREGEYFLSPATLPECCKKLKIHKQDKNGEIKKKFKTDLYYVSLKEFVLNFNTGRYAELGNMSRGIFNAGAEGTITLFIKEPKVLIQGLLDEFAYIRKGEAENIIRNWINDAVLKCFTKNNFSITDFISLNKEIEDKTFNLLSSLLSKFGLSVINFNLTNYLLPKKYQKEYQKNKKLQEEYLLKKVEEENAQTEQINSEEVNDLLDNSNMQQTEQQDLEEKELNEEENQDENVAYVPFGDFMFSKKEDNKDLQQTNINDNLIEENLDNNQVCDENQIINESSYNENLDCIDEVPKEENDKDFVDLDIDKIVASEEEDGKRCLKCGAVNDYDAKYCNVCNNKF